ncbi:MAG: hypothetical protein ACTHUY_04355 [Flaviflexus sp.]|uniref:hypothetical protein n=1 Tax=Flaviflexus sp. TaxID=1969482 RepID=UPI003F8FC75D
MAPTSTEGTPAISRRFVAISICAVILVVALIAAFSLIPSYLDDRDEKAYQQGRYDIAYDMLEIDLRSAESELFEATLLASTCRTFSQEVWCDMLNLYRESLQEHSLPNYLTDASTEEYRAAATVQSSTLRQLHADQERTNRMIFRVKEWTENDEVLKLIDETVAITRDIRQTLQTAERALDNGATVLEKPYNALREEYDRYLGPSYPTYTTVEDLTAARDRLDEAHRDLEESIAENTVQ